ncbi:MAG: hypothetical protein ACRDGT_11780, partial [Candidatus Limnocylindria bacterium]
MLTAAPVVLSLHQRSAPLDARERIWAAVADLPARPDLLTLMSCHRVEVYAALDGESARREVLERALGTAGPDLAHARWIAGEDAVRHLFRVAAGIDSVVVGEGQIGGQLRRSHLEARRRGLHPVLDRALQRALAVARELRTTTWPAGADRSVGSLAVDAALSQLQDPREATALV